MKIGVNSRIYQNQDTGIQYYLKNLFRTLQEIDKNNQYVFFQTNESKKLGQTNIIPIPNNFLGRTLFDVFLVNKLIKRERVDILIGPSHVLPFNKIKAVKYILVVHDLFFLVHPKLVTKSYQLYSKFIFNRSLLNADIIIADSLNTKNEICRFYELPSEKIKVIHLGVDQTFFESKYKKRLIKYKYFFSLTTQPTRKNIDGVLKAISNSRLLKTYKYVIAGLIDKKHLNLIKNAIKKLGLRKKVVVLGYVTQNELISLYNNAEFFVYPSFYEGFGLPVLEAMACKCPIIASNTSSIPELITHKDWLVNPFNPNDIGVKIKKLLNLNQAEREKLITNNYNHVKKFTWKKTAQEYLTIFNSLKD